MKETGKYIKQTKKAENMTEENELATDTEFAAEIEPDNHLFNSFIIARMILEFRESGLSTLKILQRHGIAPAKSIIALEILQQMGVAEFRANNLWYPTETYFNYMRDHGA